MANPFLNKTDLVERDIETALMLEQANRLDIGKAVAYTDGDKIFINTEDNLFNILPAYDQRMLKWLLWHERMHMELKHHNRFFKYLEELSREDTEDKFGITKEEVNIIMDILVHDWMASKFPELVETAINNVAQFRNRNSLGYTFKTFTLEEMLDEYSKDKHKGKDEGKGTKAETGEEDEKSKGSKDESKEESEMTEEEKEKATDDKSKGRKAHSEGSSAEPESSPDKDTEEEAILTDEPEPEHDKTDWSKLEEIDTKEFITKDESDRYTKQINELKRKKFRLAKLTETLNGLATSTRRRSYIMPSTVYCGTGILLKGSTPGRTKLALCFDASGSMGSELATFKDIISKSIPQAMQTPTSWFSGYGAKISPDPSGRSSDYYKGQFKDIMSVRANDGYGDDGDRTIELCWQYEQQGYCPIGVTDGGGKVSWSKEKLKQLKHTILVVPVYDKDWVEIVKKINPSIQIIEV